MEDYYNEAIGAIAFLSAYFIFIFVFVVGAYIVSVLAYYFYLKKRGYRNAWAAFIPYYNSYALADATYGSGTTISLFGWDVPELLFKLFPLAYIIASGVAAAIPIQGWALCLILTLLYYLYRYQLMVDMLERMDEAEGSPVIAAISLFINIVFLVFLYIDLYKHKDDDFSYNENEAPLKSQTVTGGFLSFLNKKA